MAEVSWEGVQRLHPGATVPAVDNLDLVAEDGEFLVLVGPSGCGKSTTLRMLAGLEEATAGRISIGGKDVTHVAPKERDVAMVFQNYALYPHMTVAENMAFSLKVAGVGKDERDRKVREVASLLQLTDFLERRPKALSGGQRQRVAMGRAIVREPQVFCMDEPLSNLDASLRVSTRTQIASLQRRLGITTVYVTHDQVEAMTMGDRVAVLNHGVLQQVDTPLNLFDRPANLFVAGFVGSPAMNLIPAKASDGRAVFDNGAELPIDRAAAAKASGDIVVGVRPHTWRRVAEPQEGVTLAVDAVEELGADAFVYGNLLGGASAVVARLEPRLGIVPGHVVHLAVDPADVHIFDSETGLRLSD